MPLRFLGLVVLVISLCGFCAFLAGFQWSGLTATPLERLALVLLFLLSLGGFLTALFVGDA